MVSDFEAEGRDDDDEVSIPVPENDEESSVLATVAVQVGVNPAGDLAGVTTPRPSLNVVRPKISDSTSLGNILIIHLLSSGSLISLLPIFFRSVNLRKLVTQEPSYHWCLPRKVCHAQFCGRVLQWTFCDN